MNKKPIFQLRLNSDVTFLLNYYECIISINTFSTFALL